MADGKKKKFGAVKIAAIIVAVIVIGLLAVPLFVDINRFQPELESQLTSALGRDVQVGELKLSLFSGAVGVSDISIGDDPAFSSSPFLQAKSLKVGVEMMPLVFSKEIRITEISLDTPSINLIRSSNGQWNFSSLGSGSGKESGNNATGGGSASGDIAEKDIVIHELKISDGSITIHQGGADRKPTTYSNVDITASNLSFATTFPFSLSADLPGGGSLSLKGNAGPVNKSDLAATPLEASIAVKGFDLIESGFASTDAGLDGVLDFDGVLSSDGKKMESKGTAQVDGLQIVQGGAPASQKVSLEYVMQYTPSTQSGVLENAKIAFGKAVANLSGSFRKRGEGMAMNMNLRGNEMPVNDVKNLLPAFGVVLPEGATLDGGVLNTNMNAEGPVNALTITGASDLTNTRIVGFDLAGKLAALAKLAGIQSNPETVIETLASRVRMTAQGIRVNDIRLVVPAIGELYGDGVVSPDQALDFKMRALVKASGGVGGALNQLIGGGKSGTMTIPFFIRGTAEKPKFVPDMKNTAGSILGSQLSGKSGSDGEQSDTGKAIGDAIKNLFGE